MQPTYPNYSGEPVKLTLPQSPFNHQPTREAALETVLRDREQELLEIKGPCSNKSCPLHYAHRGPCDAA
jgi:hypothetical protein